MTGAANTNVAATKYWSVVLRGSGVRYPFRQRLRRVPVHANCVHFVHLRRRFSEDGLIMSRHGKLIALLLAAPLFLSGCAGPAGDPPAASQGSLEQSQLEMRVLDTVDGPAEAAYDPANGTVHLTVYFDDVDDVSADEVDEIRRTAEEAVADQGVKVVVEPSDETPPGPE